MNSLPHFFATISTEGLPWLKAILVLLLFWLGGFFIRRIIFHYLHRWSQRTDNQLDDIIILKSRFHLLFWAILLGSYAAIRVAPLGPSTIVFLNKVIFSAFLLSLTLLAGNIAAGVIAVYGERVSLSLPLTSLTQNLFRLVIIVIGVLILLSHFGISITPLLTALGVGSLAVALALQDTLSNLFAGFYILSNRQIRPGDFVQLESGQKGYIMDIGWRETRLKELSNNIIIVPNSKLGNSIVTNYFLPEKKISVTVDLGVAYGSDLEKVERVTTEVARQTLNDVTGGIKGFEPFIRFNAFGDSCINLTVILMVQEFVDQYLVKHEFIKRLHQRYAREGIEIPYPQRVVHLSKPS